MTKPEPLILLTGYDAKRCARRIHNEWNPTVEAAPWEAPPELQLRFDAGREFEDEVVAELKDALGPERYVDLRDRRGKQSTIDATVAAMDAGAAVIIGGWLPDDVTGGRSGRPDLLLRRGSGYVPADIKGHLMTRDAKRGKLTRSQLMAPATTEELEGRAVRATERFTDFLQVAHYWRMLETGGRTPSDTTPVGAIIGTDQPRTLTWLPLDEPLFSTYSRSEGTKKRTALERYDHEHDFRRRVAEVAVRLTGAPDDPQPLVEPIFTHECDACPWLDHCRAIADPDVASARITSGRLSVREWHALAALGIDTVDDLADLEADADFQGRYLPEVTHVRDPLKRLGDAVRRARMLSDGRTLERETAGPIEVPRADVEIDFDIEWDVDDRVYLWGALVSRPGQEPTYRPFVMFDPLDEAAELALATEFAEWLRGEIAAAAGRRETLLVYHYTSAEPTYLKRVLGADVVSDLLDRFVDLYPTVREHFFGVDGLGIKKVAPAFGFTWRDDDPGGLQSQLWLVEARTGDDEGRDAARQRVLAYNEDDVRATHAVRNGL